MCLFLLHNQVKDFIFYFLFIDFNIEIIEDYKLIPEYFCDFIPKVFCIMKISHFYFLQSPLLTN